MTNTLDRQCTNILRFLRWMSCKWPTAVIPACRWSWLLAMPGLTVIRPVDANETAVAYKPVVESRRRPVLLVRTR